MLQASSGDAWPSDAGQGVGGGSHPGVPRVKLEPLSQLRLRAKQRDKYRLRKERQTFIAAAYKKRNHFIHVEHKRGSLQRSGVKIFGLELYVF